MSVASGTVVLARLITDTPHVILSMLLAVSRRFAAPDIEVRALPAGAM